MVKTENLRVIITGANGFIGTKLSIVLNSLGVKVYPVTRKVDTLSNIQPNSTSNKELLFNVKSLKSFLLDINPHVIFHLAHNNLINKNYSNQTSLYLDDIMHANLIQATLDAKIRPHLIFLGSCAEYGFSESPFKEDMNPSPITNYGKSKWNQTKKVFKLNNSEDPSWTIIRPSIVYGPRQKQLLLIPQIIDAFFLKKTIEIINGSHTRDFIFVDDLVLALKNACLSSDSITSEIINIGFGKSFKIKDVAKEIAHLLGSNYADYLLFNSLQNEPYKLEKYEVNIDKAKKLLKWEPKIDLTTGLHKTLAAKFNMKFKNE